MKKFLFTPHMWEAVSTSRCSDRELSQLITATLDSSLRLTPEAPKISGPMQALSTLLEISSRQAQDGAESVPCTAGTRTEIIESQTKGAETLTRNCIQISKETWEACQVAGYSDRDAGRLWQAVFEEVFTGARATGELSGTLGAVARLIAACIQWETGRPGGDRAQGDPAGSVADQGAACA